MIPDAPFPPWVLAYAHVDGTEEYTRITDRSVLGQDCTCSRPTRGRFLVGSGRFSPAFHDVDCPGQDVLALPLVKDTDDEAEALAVFHEQAELLCHRDALVEKAQ